MNIYQFINSKDIREYLENLNYQFTIPEAAFLIYQSHYTTLNEKITAWREIIQTMPDCALSGEMHSPLDSFHDFLREYISLQQKQIELFYQEENAVYRYSEHESATCDTWDENGWSREYEIFSDFSSCLFHQRLFSPPESFNKVAFRKQTFFQFTENKMDTHSETEISLIMDSDFRILSVDSKGILNNHESEIESVFRKMYFEFPTPFQRGDIVIDRIRQSSPCVLTYIHTKDLFKIQNISLKSKYIIELEKELEKKRAHKDTSDMTYCALYETSFGLYEDNTWNYLNLEKYREPLKKHYRLLQPVSNALSSGKPIDIEKLCNTYSLDLQEVHRSKLQNLKKNLKKVNLMLSQN